MRPTTPAWGVRSKDNDEDKEEDKDMGKMATTGTIAEVVRHGSSANGNPRWAVTLDDGRRWLTQVDGQVGYMADNFRRGARVMVVVEDGTICRMDEA